MQAACIQLRSPTLKVEMLVAQRRRVRTSGNAHVIQATIHSGTKDSKLNRLRLEVQKQEPTTAANRGLLESESQEDSFESLEKDEHVERLLQELKARQTPLA